MLSDILSLCYTFGGRVCAIELLYSKLLNCSLTKDELYLLLIVYLKDEKFEPALRILVMAIDENEK